ncbi:MAG TPA: hypothetical protein VK714_06440 [Myxococcota bacterium]|nr:hypothetical protein [Myxococcota bacterium]
MQLEARLSAERLGYARAIVLGAEVSAEGWLAGVPIVGNSA